MFTASILHILTDGGSNIYETRQTRHSDQAPGSKANRTKISLTILWRESQGYHKLFLLHCCCHDIPYEGRALLSAVLAPSTEKIFYFLPKLCSRLFSPGVLILQSSIKILKQNTQKSNHTNPTQWRQSSSHHLLLNLLLPTWPMRPLWQKFSQRSFPSGHEPRNLLFWSGVGADNVSPQSS